jgi:hypothetical protein
MHCGSFQNWRGHINLSSSVLALLVALVSVASVALPPVFAAWRSGSTDIVFSGQVVRNEAIFLVATNLGDRPGVIERGTIESPYLPPHTVLQITAANSYVPPGAKLSQIGVILRATREGAMGRILQIATHAPSAPAALVTVWGRGAGGEQLSGELWLTTLDVTDLLSAHARRCSQVDLPTYDNGCTDQQILTPGDERYLRELDAVQGRNASAPSRVAN